MAPGRVGIPQRKYWILRIAHKGTESRVRNGHANVLGVVLALVGNSPIEQIELASAMSATVFHNAGSKDARRVPFGCVVLWQKHEALVLPHLLACCRTSAKRPRRRKVSDAPGIPAAAVRPVANHRAAVYMPRAALLG